MNQTIFRCYFRPVISLLISGAFSVHAADIKEDVRGEHDAIGNAVVTATSHTRNPDAQWYPDAGFGLFIHWGIASVKGINISWPMRDGMGGKPAAIAPNDYFAMAKDFNPQNYDPDKWLKAAKDAGFTYAVLTTRHHEGFALWPSDYGDFSTKNYMGGRDLVKDYVDACRRNGLKVGLYYSPPNWYFDRDFMNYSVRPDGPSLGPDLKPRQTKKSAAEIAAHNKKYAQLVRGQLEELLTHYGKIDLLWFDGQIPNVDADDVMSIDHIRRLQPGIVVNGRFHGHGDFINFERNLTVTSPTDGWVEYCNPWTSVWPYVPGAKCRAPGYILGQLAQCRSLHVNYLLDIGPKPDGQLTDEIYSNLAIVRDWMETNGESIKMTLPLPRGESANVYATSAGAIRYLFALPKFQEDGANGHRAYPKDLLPAEDITLTLSGIFEPASVKLLGDSRPVDFSYTNQTVTIHLPASRRTQLVDVVKVDLQ